MASEPPIDPLPLISQWLSELKTEITSFWIGADWRLWARFELYMHLEEALGSDCLVSHSIALWSDDSTEVDVLLEPRDDKKGDPIAIKLRCENVNENEGSWERFCEQYDGDVEKIKAMGGKAIDYEKVTLLLVGLSNEPVGLPDEELAFQTEPKPILFTKADTKLGNLHGWVWGYDLPHKE